MRNVLSYKKHSKIIVLLAITSVVVLNFGFAVNRVTAETPTDTLTVHEAYEIVLNHFQNNTNFENNFEINYTGVNVISERHTPLISGHRFEVDFSTGEVIFCYVAIHGGAIFYADLNDDWVEIMLIENT